jgi:hypothetical protein
MVEGKRRGFSSTFNCPPSFALHPDRRQTIGGKVSRKDSIKSIKDSPKVTIPGAVTHNCFTMPKREQPTAATFDHEALNLAQNPLANATFYDNEFYTFDLQNTWVGYENADRFSFTTR